MSLRLRLAVLCAFGSGCFDLSLPPQPGVGPPGLVSGRLVWQRPGRLQLEPARGASVFVLGTNLAAASNDDGRFLIDGLISGEGTLFIRFDGDGDGHAERQRALLLSDLGAGRGRQLSLGDLTLGQSAAVTGRVLLGDVGDANAHFDTPVFVPGFPLATLTQPDGTFVLEGLAEGSAQLGAVRAGYEAWLSGPVALRGGEELSLARITLGRALQSPSGVLRGRVVGADGTALGGVTVTTSGGQTASTDALGVWLLSGLAVDRYDVTFSAAGRLPAALYNVLVAGRDEVVAPDVVLAEGQSPSGTPSLVGEVSGDRDAGVDAGPRDGGADGGTDGGVDAGSYVVNILGLNPLNLFLPSGSTLMTAQVLPDPGGAARYQWTASRVILSAPTMQTTTVTAAAAPGPFRLDLVVTIAGQTYGAFVGGNVLGADAGAPAPLVTGDAGATALSLWLECEGPFSTALTGAVQNESTSMQVPATLSYNGVTGRLVAVFDEPQPDASITLSLPSLTLSDGGVRAPLAVRRTSGPLTFGPAVLLVDGGLVDFSAGATYRPTGLIAVGRTLDDAGVAWLEVHTAAALENRSIAMAGPPVVWRRANSAGFTTQAWASTAESFRAIGTGNTWMPSVLPPGAVFADGPSLRAVRGSATSLDLSTWDGTAWTPFTGTIGSFAVTQQRSSVASLPGVGLVALVIDDSGQVKVLRDGSSWADLSATLPGLPTILSGRIAVTNAGYVMFLEHASGAVLLTYAGGSWTQRTFTGKMFDVVGRGSRAYLVAANASTELLEVWLVDPVSGRLSPVGVPVSGPVRSAELAVADFGELGLAWSVQNTAYDLLLAEIK